MEQFNNRLDRLNKSITQFMKTKQKSIENGDTNMETIKKMFDFNKDGNVDKKDLEAFISTSNILWSVVIGVLISAFLDTIGNWWESGIWSWDLILICAKFDIFPAIIAFVKKLFDKSDFVKNLTIEQLKNQLQSKDLTNQLLQQKIDLQLVPK